jgi:hypothetical protein
MLDLFRQSIANQFGGSLKMLEDCISKCEQPQWTAPVAKFPFWHLAYHILFYTDLYLSPSLADFRPPSFHRADANFLGRQPFPPFKEVLAGPPFEKRQLIDYLKSCRGKVVAIMAGETESSLAGPSGFDWIPFPRLQLHLYNLRHIQHHTGALSAFLLRTQGKTAAWVGFDPLL